MKIGEIKSEMLKYEDFFGGSLIGRDQIEKCTTKKQLAEIIDEHESFLEAQVTDAQSSLRRFKQKLGLNHLP